MLTVIGVPCSICNVPIEHKNEAVVEINDDKEVVSHCSCFFKELNKKRV